MAGAENQIDFEWVLLISLAKELGLSKEEIRAFFKTTEQAGQAIVNKEKAV